MANLMYSEHDYCLQEKITEDGKPLYVIKRKTRDEYDVEIDDEGNFSETTNSSFKIYTDKQEAKKTIKKLRRNETIARNKRKLEFEKRTDKGKTDRLLNPISLLFILVFTLLMTMLILNAPIENNIKQEIQQQHK